MKFLEIELLRRARLIGGVTILGETVKRAPQIRQNELLSPQMIGGLANPKTHRE
jgi:hypothetical protein